jgi:capping protein beta
VEGDRYVKSGSWDSIHVVEAVEANNKTSATYKLTTTIMLSMSVERQEVGETLLSGSLTRQVRLFHFFLCPI